MTEEAVNYRYCSTHVYFSFDDHVMTPSGNAKLISVAATYFKNAIKDLMPLHWRRGWREHRYNRPNMYDRFSRGSDTGHCLINMREAWNRIRKTETVEELAGLVCKNDQGPQPAAGTKRIGPLRFFKWTIYGLVNKTTSSVRCPRPGVPRTPSTGWTLPPP